MIIYLDVKKLMDSDADKQLLTLDYKEIKLDFNSSLSIYFYIIYYNY